jgi:hypothetical protein
VQLATLLALVEEISPELLTLEPRECAAFQHAVLALTEAV